MDYNNAAFIRKAFFKNWWLVQRTIFDGKPRPGEFPAKRRISTHLVRRTPAMECR